MDQEQHTDKPIETLVKNTAIFAVGTFASRVLVLLVTPLCTHFISTEDMGTYDLLYTIVLLLQPIAVLAVPESLFRWLLDDSSDKKSIVSTWTTLFVLLFAAFSVVYWAVCFAVGFDNAVLLYVLVAMSCVYQSLQYGTRGLHSNKLFAAQGVLYAVLYTGFSFLFVACLGVGYKGLLYALLIAMTACSIVMVARQPDIRRLSLAWFSRASAGEMLRYSVFLLPNALSWWALSWLSRLFVVGFLGLAANGIFSIATRFPSALSMIVNIFIPAWQEQAVGTFQNEGRDGYYSLVFRHYARLVLSSLLVILPLTGLFVSLFIDPAYGEVIEYVPALYFGAVFSALASFFGVFYLCAKNTGGAAVTTVLGVAVTAISNYVLIPLLGLQGACLANMLGNLTMWLARLVQTRDYCTIAIRRSELLALMASVIVMSAAVAFILDNRWYSVLLVLGCALVFVINRSSLSYLASMIRDKISKCER